MLSKYSVRICDIIELYYRSRKYTRVEPPPVPVHHFRIKRQFNPGFSPNSPNFQQQQQRPWGQQNPNLNGGLNAQRPPQGQFPFQGSSNLQGQSLSNQLLGNQQQQSSNNNLAGSVNSNQQGSTSTNNNNQAGSSNNNQQVLWSSNQSDYQCVINNCRGQSLWNPICGTDNLVYDNVAVFRCAQQCGRRISFSYYGTCVITTTAASK
ncbi:hypothetical protein U1Q18_042294 [Sarracenia purpurea var. burkii]